jgi:hypothetical protein
MDPPLVPPPDGGFCGWPVADIPLGAIPDGAAEAADGNAALEAEVLVDVDPHADRVIPAAARPTTVAAARDFLLVFTAYLTDFVVSLHFLLLRNLMRPS